MFEPPRPPPIPPSLLIKGTIPVTNKDLLFSIEKGIKLKKIPESMKNDRSEVSFSKNCVRNGQHINSPVVGIHPSIQTRNFSMFQTELNNKLSVTGNGNQSGTEKSVNIPSKQISRFSIDNGIQKTSGNQSNQFLTKKVELSTPLHLSDQLSRMLDLNMSNFSLSTRSNMIPFTKPSNIPLQNQLTASLNRPPSPPPVHRNSVPCDNFNSKFTISKSTFGEEESLFSQSPFVKTMQQPQLNSSQWTTEDFVNSIQSKSSVTRLTKIPPPPIPNAMRKELQNVQASDIPPPLPSRVSRVSSQFSRSRPASFTETIQYNVRDRPPPPLPVHPNTAALPSQPPQSLSTCQSTKTFPSMFDYRFNFPNENLFPNLKNRKISDFRFSKSFSIN